MNQTSVRLDINKLKRLLQILKIPDQVECLTPLLPELFILPRVPVRPCRTSGYGYGHLETYFRPKTYNKFQNGAESGNKVQPPYPLTVPSFSHE